MPVFNNALAGAAGSGGDAGYKIERSLRFNSADSAYLNRTPSSASNRRTWTLSFWVKKHRNSGNAQQIFGQYRSNSPEAQNRFQLYFLGTNELEIHTYSLTHLKTNRVFRDNSAWYHIVLAVDTTLSTANNRMRLYVNGVEETSFATRNNPSQNLELGVNTDGEINIGTAPNAKSSFYADINLADVQFVDGQQLAATDFGKLDDNNVWQPKKFTGTYGPLVDQSQTWSTYGSHTGSTNNSTGTGWQSAFDALGTTYTWSTNGSDLTFTSAIPYTQKVEIWGYKFNSSDAIRVNGSAVSGFNIGNSDSQLSWVTALSGSGNLTSIGSTGYGLIAQVRVDGKLLIDAGVSVVNNGFHLDFSDNSSNAALGTCLLYTSPSPRD